MGTATFEVEHFPFTMDDDRAVIHDSVLEQYDRLLHKLNLTSGNRLSFFNWLDMNLDNAESSFEYEEQLRESGRPGANLTYHNVLHAVLQVSYDSAAIDQVVIQPNHPWSQFISLEAIAASLVGANLHDSGYVEAEENEGPIQNYAQRIGIHVARSMDVFSENLMLIPPPGFLDRDKINRLGRIDIHSTHFPFDATRKAEQRALLAALPPAERAEAAAGAIITRYADLAGQAARKDRFPRGLIALRDEYNGEKPGKGDAIIGLDHELVKKTREFIRDLLEPQMNRYGYLLFGTEDNSFSRDWRDLPESD